ncbi:cytochrome P450 [Bacillus sp. NTK071]|uniref:cytochrome P450 n=1 Tax=Bacillus sp. NTK071 TaxID=2802175 RepID=UPI001A905834|nr:cytochrome P450 [Bacillus sp. NTK071]MBN8207826.1 cytochrome P450 [Bacillus sp. NTK071]
MKTVEKLSGIRLKNYLDFRKDPLKFLSQTREIADFVELGASSFVVHKPDAIKEILVTHASSFQKGASAWLLSKTIGRGLLTSEGKEHLRQRRLILPAFHKEKLEQYKVIILEETERFIKSWRDDDKRCISNEMMKLTLCIIVKIMFGKDVLEDDSEEVVDAVTHIIEKSASDLFLPFPVPEFIPSPRNKRYTSGRECLRDLADLLIDQAPDGDHLLRLLQTAKYDDGSCISREEIKSQVLTMLIAGHETTANVLSWMWYELSRSNPQEDKLLSEWRSIDQLDMKSFKQTGQFLKETLRLYPAAWMLLREATAPVNLSGQEFKQGSSFLISPYIMHRNPTFFKDPNQFDSNRFSEDNTKEIQPFAYIPFGAGPRSCIGNQFATMEALLIISTIGKKFRLELMADHHSVEAEPLISLRIKNGLYMKVHERKQ